MRSFFLQTNGAVEINLRLFRGRSRSCTDFTNPSSSTALVEEPDARKDADVADGDAAEQDKVPAGFLKNTIDKPSED